MEPRIVIPSSLNLLMQNSTGIQSWIQDLLYCNSLKTFQFKTQCKGVTAHIENCTDHFGEDIDGTHWLPLHTLSRYPV